MKRRIGLGMAIVLLTGTLMACGSDDGTNNNTNNKLTEEDENTLASEIPTEDEEVKKEVYKFVGVCFEGLKTFDFGVFEKHALNTNRIFFEKLQNKENLEFFKKVISDKIYLEDSGIFLYHSPNYILARWYMDCVQEGKEIPKSISELTVEECRAVYDRYAAEAPYIGESVLGFKCEKKNDGYSFDFQSMIGDGASKYYNNGNIRDVYLFMTDDEKLSKGADAIYTCIPEAEVLLSKDLSKMCEYIEENLEEKYKTMDNPYYVTYLNYYKDETNRAVIQKYFDENVKCYHSAGKIVMMRPVSFEYDDVYKSATEETKSKITGSLSVNSESVITAFCSDFDNGFKFYDDIAKLLKAEGAF